MASRHNSNALTLLPTVAPGLAWLVHRLEEIRARGDKAIVFSEFRDVQRLINQDRNSFAASMVALGDADGMVTGVTRAYDQALEEILRVTGDD